MIARHHVIIKRDVNGTTEFVGLMEMVVLNVMLVNIIIIPVSGPVLSVLLIRTHLH